MKKSNIGLSVSIAFIFWTIATSTLADSYWTRLNNSLSQVMPLNTLNKNETTPVDEALAQVGLAVHSDDITPDQDSTKFVLTPEQIHQALVWQLTSEQEKRYVFLMQNRAAIQYKDRNLSPIWILGLNARTDAERTYYAHLAALQERQYVAQNLAWRNAFDVAYSELVQGFPIIKPFNTDKFSPYHVQPVQYQADDVLDLFIRPNDPIRGALSSLLTALTIQPTLVLNIYMVGTSIQAATIQSWAKEQSIPVNLVDNKRITLNEGNQQYAALKMDKKPLPLLLLIRKGQALSVDLGQL